MVLRHLRIRTGDADTPRDGWDNRDVLNFGHRDRPDSTYNVVVDHCSLSWGVDEKLTVWYRSHDITIQWCLIANGLDKSKHPKGPHSMGVLIGDGASRVSFHHNLVANCGERNIQLGGCKGRRSNVVVANNLVFNWRNEPAAAEHAGNTLTFVGNCYQPGPDTNPRGRGCFRVAKDAGDLELDIRGNLDEKVGDVAADNWPSTWLESGSTPPTAGHRLAAPVDCPPITLQDAVLARTYVICGAGARLPKRDAADVRVLLQGLGLDLAESHFLDSPSQVGGWRELAAARALMGERPAVAMAIAAPADAAADAERVRATGVLSEVMVGALIVYRHANARAQAALLTLARALPVVAAADGPTRDSLRPAIASFLAASGWSRRTRCGSPRARRSTSRATARRR